jgi:dolichol-phosphate mannosyltransferase
MKTPSLFPEPAAIFSEGGPSSGWVRVVLPAYNEEATLPALLARLDRAFAEARLAGDVLVVNDGSADGTAEEALRFRGEIPVRLLDLQPNRGLAGAMRAGLWEAIQGADADDIVITMDADNSHPPGLMRRMVWQIREGSDVVIASRYQPGATVRGVTGFRQLLSLGASFLFRAAARVPGVRDYTCGYRAYRVALLQDAFRFYDTAFIQQQGFGCMAEILLKLRPLEPIIHEVPLILRYDLKESASKMKVARTVRETLLMLMRHTLQRG